MARHLRAAIAAISLLAAPLAAAHEFRVAVIADYSGPQAAAAERLWRGLRVAAREHDGHADETADGHLGGVDVHLLRVDAAAAQATDRLLEIAAVQGAVIAVLGAGGHVVRWPTGIDVVLIAAEAAAAPDASALRAPAAPSVWFEDTYQESYGEAADAVARSGYSAGRLIAAGVRPLDGALADVSAVRASFAAALRR